MSNFKVKQDYTLTALVSVYFFMLKNFQRQVTRILNEFLHRSSSIYDGIMSW